jgi:hypothetical protein
VHARLIIKLAEEDVRTVHVSGSADSERSCEKLVRGTAIFQEDLATSLYCYHRLWLSL